MKARKEGKWKKSRKQKKRRKEDRKRKKKKRGCKVWMLWVWSNKSTKCNTDRGKRRDKGEKEEKKRREKRGWNTVRMGRFFFLLILMVMQKCWNIGRRMEKIHWFGEWGETVGPNISLFLEDWELARVALSCHLALDMLCQEMHQAW